MYLFAFPFHLLNAIDLYVACLVYIYINVAGFLCSKHLFRNSFRQPTKQMNTTVTGSQKKLKFPL